MAEPTQEDIDAAIAQSYADLGLEPPPPPPAPAPPPPSPTQADIDAAIAQSYADLGLEPPPPPPAPAPPPPSPTQADIDAAIAQSYADLGLEPPPPPPAPAPSSSLGALTSPYPEEQQPAPVQTLISSPTTPVPKPTPEAPSNVEVLGTTTGADKYIVKEDGIQKIMSKVEIESKGGVLPPTMEAENKITQAVTKEEMTYEKARDKFLGEVAAKEMGMTQEELTTLITAHSREELLQKLADKYGLSIDAASKLIKEYNDNPDAPKFAKLNEWVRRDLAVFKGEKDFIQSIAWSLAWNKLNAANKENPEIFKTVSINYIQTNILNLAEAAKSGIDAETLNLIGQSVVQWGANFPIIIKEDARDSGTFYPFGFEGITQYKLNELKNREQERLAALQTRQDELSQKFKDYRIEDKDNEYDISKLIQAVNNNEVSLEEVEELFGKDILNKINEVNDAADAAHRGATRTIAGVAQVKNVKIEDFNSLSVDEMVALINGGLDPKVLVTQGQDINRVNDAVDAVNNRYQEWEGARDKLWKAGFVAKENYDVAIPANIANLAKYQRDNPDDTDSISLYYGDDTAQRVRDFNQEIKDTRSEVEEYLSRGGDRYMGPVAMLPAPDYAYNVALRNAMTSVLSETRLGGVGKGIAAVVGFIGAAGGGTVGSLEKQWLGLTEDEKDKVVQVIARDVRKGSVFAGIESSLENLQQSTGLLGMVTFAPITPISHVVAKQLTLDEARNMLNNEYSEELGAVEDYRRSDGTIDINRLKFQMDYNPNLRDDILKKTGYEKTDDLVKNLEYYNNGMKVTTEEWAVAGAVGALDVLMLGGGGALAGAGLGGRLALGGVQVGSAGVFLPSSIRTIRSPDVSIPEKVLAGAMPVLLVAGGALSLKAPSGATLSPIGKVKVPVKAEVMGEIPAIAEAVRATEIPRPSLQARIINDLYNVAYDVKSTATATATAFKNAPQNYVTALTNANKELENAITSISTKMGKTANYAVIELPVKVGNQIVSTSQAIAKGMADASQYMLKELPRGASDAYLTAIAKASDLMGKASIYITRDLPKSVGNQLINAMERVKELIVEYGQIMSKASLYATKELPKEIGDALLTTGQQLEQSITRAGEVMGKASNYAVKELPIAVGKELTDALKTYSKVAGDISNAVVVKLPIELGNSLNAGVDAVKTAIVNASDALGRANLYLVKDVPIAVSQKVSGAINSAVDLMGEVSRYTVETMPQNVGLRLNQAARAIENAITEYSQYVGQYASKAIALPAEISQKLTEAISRYSELVGQASNYVYEKLPADIKTQLTTTASAIQELSTKVFTKTGEGFGTLKQLPQEALDRLNIARESVESAIRDANTALGEASKYVVQKLPLEVGEQLLNAGRKVEQAIRDYSSAMSEYSLKAMEFPAELTVKITNGIADASEVMGKIAQYIVTDAPKDVIEGLRLTSGVIRENVVGLVRGKFDAVRKVYDEYANAIDAGIKDASAGKPKEITWVRALEQQAREQKLTQLSRIGGVGETGISDSGDIIVGGEEIIWKGLKAGDNLIVGISDGKLVFGKSGIRLPPKEQWDIPLTTAEGKPYEPRTGLETNALINRNALETAGMSPEEAGLFADRMQKTVSMVKEWYGKPEKNLNEVLLTEPIDTFSKEAVETIFRYAIENSDKVKNIKIFDRLYGSSTIRPQLSAEALAEWINEFKRMPGDFDIQLKNVSAEGAESFAKGLADKIAKETNDPAWINPDNKTLVMAKSRSTGADRHGIDIHYPDEPTIEMPVSPEAEGMVYGLQKTQPALNVKLEGIGDFKIARLSETAVGKMEQVLGWRANPETKAFELAIEPHRFPKDIIDLYEIVKTKKGAQVADEWLDFMGYDKQKLVDLQNNIVNKVTLSNDKLSNAANAINELKESVKIGVDDATIKSKLAGIRSDLTSAKDVVEGMPQSEARIAYTKANNALKELDSIVSRDIQDIPNKLSDANKGIYRSIGRELGEFSPAENARVSNIGAVAPLYTLVSPALISASRSFGIGVTSDGNLISAPIKTSPSEYPSARLTSEDVIKSELVSPSGTSSLSVPIYPSPSASIFDISPSAFTIPSDDFSLAEEPSVSEPVSPSEPLSPSRLVLPSEVVSPSEPISPSEPVSPSEYPSIYPSPKPSPYPSPYPSPVPKLTTTTTTTTGRIPIPFRAKNKDGQEVEVKVLPGSVAWVQGRPMAKGGGNAGMYKLMLPPYDQDSLYTSRTSPPGYVDEGWSGKGSVEKSLKVIGGVPPSNIDNIDLGFVKFNIKVEGGEPKIDFLHDEDANVGERHKTVGMGKGQIPVEEWEEAKARGEKYTDFVKRHPASGVVAKKPAMRNERRAQAYSTPYDENRELARTIIEESMAEEDEERRRRLKKDWWEEPIYQEQNNVLGAYIPSERYYRGRRLLPPNLEARL